MREYLVVAYADNEYGLKKQTARIKAENHEKAQREAWKLFPEYHQVGVFEQEGVRG